MRAIVLSVVMAGCASATVAVAPADAGSATAATAAGTWTTTGLKCNGTTVPLQNYVTRYTFTADSKGTFNIKTSGCEGTLTGATLKFSNGNLTVLPGTGATTCAGGDAGATCNGSYTLLTASGSVATPFKCPDQFTTLNTVTLVISGDAATADIGSGCIMSYTRL